MIRIILATLFLINLAAYDWSAVDDIVQEYYLDGAYPGGVLRIANSTHTLHEYVIGYLSKHIPPFSSPPFASDTLFDVASLTKVTATLTCFIHLYELQQIDIDDKVTDHVPEYANHGKENTTIRNLLLHNAGLLEDHPEPIPTTKEAIMKYIYNCELAYPIESKYLYSDLGFVLLGEIIERIIGGPLDDYSKILFNRIGLVNSTFLPENTTYYRIAPTQYNRKICNNTAIRKKLLQGEVDDATSFVLGGVAGDAGLFSTAADLEAFMQFYLRGGISKKGEQVFKKETLSLFWKRQEGLPYDNSRALGWDTVPTGEYPPCGHLFSKNSFGHTGYTGTMMWADRDRGLIVIFLTNRVHPSDVDITIRKVRTLLTDAIAKQFDKKSLKHPTTSVSHVNDHHMSH